MLQQAEHLAAEVALDALANRGPLNTLATRILVSSCSISTKSQRAFPVIHGNNLPVAGGVSSHKCYCSVSAPEPAVSESSSTSIKKRIVSGVQPTGSIHLGNYLGAIKKWVKYETLFFIVDLHAIALPYDVQQLSKATRDIAVLYLACGVDTSKASVFVQSHVHAHVELMWLLSYATPIGWLNGMIPFKEKSRKAMRLYCMQLILYNSFFSHFPLDLGTIGVALLDMTRSHRHEINISFGSTNTIRIKNGSG
ncbi:putative tryptophan--tRNA ligase [Helianthus annuus]|nr:putative tryptophan--tRNA ligase [Helianthus annuus]KAJ0633220.1 putative tryptophan--tRNA ligase [Helianthus annuus]KAJ0814104.1 putative tryptophan--tRNA ligase [Helianthus annuus]